MAKETVKSLIGVGGGRRALAWKDVRNRSPKAVDDFSGIIMTQNGSTRPAIGVQDFSYETVSKILLCSDLVWTCIDLVSSTAALGKLKVRRRDSKSTEYLPDHPLQKMLDNPNPGWTQFELIQSYVVHQRLFGTVAQLLIRDSMSAPCTECLHTVEMAPSGESPKEQDCAHKLFVNNTGPVTQIMQIHPSMLDQRWVKMPDGSRRQFFFYIPEPGREYPIHPDNILTDAYYNPDAGFWGISPTYLLKRWLDLDQMMTTQVQKFFENGAIPSLIVNMKPGNNFTYEQEPNELMKMMKEKWVAQFNHRSGNAKTPAFVYGDIDVKKIEENMNEIVSKNLYYEIQSRVCAAFGVPPTLFEVGMRYGSQLSNASQVEKDFYNRTISKIMARIERKYNKYVVPSYGEEGLEVVWDLSEMGVADFLIQDKKTSVRKDWELGLIKRDEARASLGYEPIGGEFGDDFYRLTVMSDGNNTDQAQGMDNRLVQPKDPGKPSASNNVAVQNPKDK